MEFLKDFGVNPLLLAAQVVNFFILLFILKKLLYGPILKVLAERKKRIEESLRNAEEIEKKLLQTEEDREKILAKAAKETQKMMDETKKEIAAMREEARQQAEQQVALILKKGEKNLWLKEERMMGEVRAQVANLVVAVFHKVTGKSLSKEDQKEIIEKEIKNLS